MSLDVVTWLVQFFVPLALVGWVWTRRGGSRGSRALNVTLVGSYLLLIWLSGLWLALPRWTVGVHALLLAGAATASGHKRISKTASGGAWAGLSVGLRGIAVIALMGAVGYALLGRRPVSDDTVDLAFPLRTGTYLVVNGGSNLLVNFHIETLEKERARPFRGQSYAVDLVKVGRWGSRDTGIAPDELSGFAIFGDPIHAPCSGTVVAVEDGHPDRRPPGEAPRTLAGNHVIVACDEAWIVLAHMRRGSVGVSQGEQVRVGAVVGRVGNSGSSGEPHLHVHAQTPGTREAPLGGSPLPVTFDGRHLVRNDRPHESDPGYPGGRTTRATAGKTRAADHSFETAEKKESYHE